MKKFFNYFNIFELNLSSRTYKSGIIRILASALVMFLVCIFRLNITITDIGINIFLTIFLLAIMVMAVLCMFIAAVECLQVGDNRKKDKERNQHQ